MSENGNGLQAPIEQLLSEWDWYGWKYLRESVAQEYEAMKAIAEALRIENARLRKDYKFYEKNPSLAGSRSGHYGV